MGVDNLFKGVNNTRLGFATYGGGGGGGGFVLFLSLSWRPNVLSVWIVKSGRGRLNTTRSLLVIHLTRHRTLLTLTPLGKA